MVLLGLLLGLLFTNYASAVYVMCLDETAVQPGTIIDLDATPEANSPSGCAVSWSCCVWHVSCAVCGCFTRHTLMGLFGHIPCPCCRPVGPLNSVVACFPLTDLIPQIACRIGDYIFSQYADDATVPGGACICLAADPGVAWTPYQAPPAAVIPSNPSKCPTGTYTVCLCYLASLP